MQNFILVRVFRAVGEKLDGYKTKIGGVGLILLGLLGIVRIMLPDQTALPDLDIETCFAYITAGFTALGIGGKLQKQTEAIQATTPIPAELSCTVPAAPDTLQGNIDRITKGAE